MTGSGSIVMCICGVTVGSDGTGTPGFAFGGGPGGHGSGAVPGGYTIGGVARVPNCGSIGSAFISTSCDLAPPGSGATCSGRELGPVGSGCSAHEAIKPAATTVARNKAITLGEDISTPIESTSVHVISRWG